uniref:Uncharacterized protein n=1 Tax=Xenopus tropicalis TaxID=8364 RepID=A0A803J2H4_XENTR
MISGAFTLTVTKAVPDLSGNPPSMAVRRTLWVFCCSLSRGLSRTSSANLLPSLLLCTSREKKPLGLSL